MNKNNSWNHFVDGIWCCVQYLVTQHDFPTIAAGMIEDLDISVSDCKNAQKRSASYDEEMNRFIKEELENEKE